MHAYDLGLTPLIHSGLKYIFVTAYLSKSLNLSEKSSKMIKIQYTDPKLVSPATRACEAVRRCSRLPA